MKSCVSLCVSYLLPRYPHVRYQYELIHYPTPRSLLKVLQRRDFPTIARLAQNRNESEALASLALALAPMFSRRAELASQAGVGLLSLLWEVLERPLTPEKRPDIEIEGRIRSRLKTALSRQELYWSHIDDSPEEEPQYVVNVEDRLDLQKILERLSARSRWVLIGSVLYGLTTEELTEWLSVRNDGARKARNRAYEKARSLYQSRRPQPLFLM